MEGFKLSKLDSSLPTSIHHMHSSKPPPLNFYNQYFARNETCNGMQWSTLACSHGGRVGVRRRGRKKKKKNERRKWFWAQAVQDYYEVKVKTAKRSSCGENQVIRTPALIAAHDATVFDDGSVVVVTKSDLDGYKGRHESGIVGNDVWAELSLVYRVQFAGQAALARLSCVRLRCHTREKIGAEKLGKDSCSVEAEQRGGLGVDIPVY